MTNTFSTGGEEYCRGLAPPLVKGLNKIYKIRFQLHIQLATRREFMYKHYSVFLLRKNISTG